MDGRRQSEVKIFEKSRQTCRAADTNEMMFTSNQTYKETFYE
jgi:hypothetical protein